MAVPVVAYSFNIVNSKVSELKKIDAKTKKLLTMHKMHHPKSDVDRLYVAWKYGGRGLMQLETSYKRATIGLSTFLVQKHDAKKMIYSAQREAQKFFGSLIRLNYLEKQTNSHHAKRTQ